MSMHASFDRWWNGISLRAKITGGPIDAIDHLVAITIDHHATSCSGEPRHA